MTIGTTPEVHQNARPDLFVVVAPLLDPQGAQLIADGFLKVLAARTRDQFPALTLAMQSSAPLMPRICETLYGMGVIPEDSDDDHVSVHSHGVFLLPGNGHLIHLIGLQQAYETSSVMSPALRGAVLKVVAEERSRVASEVAQRAVADEAIEISLDQLEPRRRAEVEEVFDKGRWLLRPSISFAPDLRPLEPLFPRALHATSVRGTPAAVDAAALRSIRSAPSAAPAPPRDGVYECMAATADADSVGLVVTWDPHGGLAPYPEIRATLVRRMPGALARPRAHGVHPPDLDHTSAVGVREVNSISGFDTADPTWLAAFSNREFSFQNRGRAGAKAKMAVRSRGFEALGWYQGFHQFAEDSWGIYIDAEALDDAVCGFSADLRAAGLHTFTDAIAAQVIFGMLYEHEKFHALVEARLSAAELTTGKARYLGYKKDVYRPLLLSDACVEEALANFAAWSWMQTEAILLRISATLHQGEAAVLTRVAEIWLDLSPPGYNKWRIGQGWEAWRRLASQMATARLTKPIPGTLLPVEGLLKAETPFDMRAADVPLYFVGTGEVARTLMASPAVFNVPTRHELAAALAKVFGYSVVRKAGKGSHEKWRGSDGRMFILPDGSPVSRRVFGTFLEHFGLRKADYVEHVRVKALG